MANSLAVAMETPLALHPENPHYFVFRGKPTVLLTSGEHYGAVLNLDFDFHPYLAELKRCGFNLTRTFSGTYREVPGSFKIRDNTLAPKPGRFCSTWIEENGKFNLDRFNEAYFVRLKEFVGEAARQGIVVEFVLFCPLYEDELWNVSPMNSRNNVNCVGQVVRTEVLTLKHPALLDKQLAFVRKAVTELNPFDNVYFEICNEPYFGGVALDWQKQVADTIVATESGLPNRHLIAQNIANGTAEITNPHKAVSIFNFHYASPPDAVSMNRKLRKPIGFDETGFQGTGDRVYRRQAWEFLMAGGAVFSNLDYSFTTDHEDGSARVEEPTPGGGGREFRKQLRILKAFLDQFDLVNSSTDNALVRTAQPDTLRSVVRTISDPSRGIWGIYVPKGPKVKLGLNLPSRLYRIEWIDPRDGTILKAEEIDARERGTAGVVIQSPDYTEDVAARLTEPDSLER
jgi:hypothetical protein